MPVETFEFLAVDLLSGEVLSDMTPAKAVWERKVNRPGSASLTFHLHQVNRILVEPHLTALYIVRGGVCLFGGLAEQLTADGNDRTVEVGYVELTEYLHRRRLRTDLTYAATNQTQIVADLVDYTNAVGRGIDLVPIVQPTGTTVQRAREYLASDRPRVGELIEKLTDVIDGPDYELRVRRDAAGRWVREVLIANNLSRDLQASWRAGVDRGKYKVETDADRHANNVDATGAGEGPALLIANAATPDPEYPTFDDATAYRSVTELATLQEHADGDLLAQRRPIDTPVLTVAMRDLPGGPAAFRPGDTLGILVDDGAAQYDGRARVLGWKATYTRGAPTMVDVTLASILPPPLDGSGGQYGLQGVDATEVVPPPRPSGLAATLDRLDRRVEALERPQT